MAFSGSAIKQGERHAVVYATGANTFFGRAAGLIGSTHNVANIQKVRTRSPVAARGGDSMVGTDALQRVLAFHFYMAAWKWCLHALVKKAGRQEKRGW